MKQKIAREPEKMAVTFAIHDTDLEKNSFRGMASVFNTLIDTWIPTRIMPGAFTKTLAENSKRVKVLYQHNPDWPIGLPTLMEENSDGLLVEAKVSQTSMGKDCLVLLKDKVLTELSIGFDPMQYMMKEENLDGMKVQVRHVTEVRLWEFSPVTWGANAKALISSVNSLSRLVPGFESLPEDTQAFVTTMLQQFKACGEAEPTDLYRLVTHLVQEQHAGKVLSAKNKQLVSECRDMLQKLLDAAEPDDDKNARSLAAVDEKLRALTAQYTTAITSSLR